MPRTCRRRRKLEVNECLSICEKLSKKRDLRVKSVLQKGRNVVYPGIGSFLGTAIGGPTGLMIGGLAGKAVAHIFNSGAVPSPLEGIFCNLDDTKKGVLAGMMNSALQSIGAEHEDMEDPEFENACLEAIDEFVDQELHMEYDDDDDDDDDDD